MWQQSCQRPVHLPVDGPEIAGRRYDLTATALQALRYEGGRSSSTLLDYYFLYVVGVQPAELLLAQLGVGEVRVGAAVRVGTRRLSVDQVTGQTGSQKVTEVV